MRIGVITLSLYANYGGIMQAYALQTILKRMGHEVTLLDKTTRKELSWWEKPLVYSKRIVWKYVLGSSKRVFHERYYNDFLYPSVTRYTRAFVDKHIACTPVVKFKNLSNKDFDVIIVGSDQIWRPAYFEVSKQGYAPFLQFAKGWNVKRIAYAVSFGTNRWEYTRKQTIECGNLVRLFDAVSVREDSGVDLCRQHLGIEPSLVLDPTLLLDAHDYINLCKDTPKSKGNLLNYTLDKSEDKDIIVHQLSKSLNLVPFSVNNPKLNDPKADYTEKVQPPVEQWLRGFYDADFVFTDSFHACVFSIIFRRQFVVYGNKGRGMARFESLLRMFGLEDRLVTNVEDLESLRDIDYDKVFEKLDDMRKVSMAFLQKALKL